MKWGFMTDVPSVAPDQPAQSDLRLHGLLSHMLKINSFERKIIYVRTKNKFVRTKNMFVRTKK